MNATELTKEQIPQLRNIPVYTADGEKIGHVGDAYYDDDSGRLECVAVAGDALGFAKRVIPVEGATLDDDGLHLPYARDQIEASPEHDDEWGDEVDDERYRRVSDHYRGRSGDAEVVRSEEELAVGKRSVETGKVRLRKWVETEPVEMDVELKKETARVERERIDEPAPGARLGEEEVEIPLHREEAVVQKQTVAKERVRLEKDVQTEQEHVSDEVRRERVDVDEAGAR